MNKSIFWRNAYSKSSIIILEHVEIKYYRWWVRAEYWIPFGQVNFFKKCKKNDVF